MSSFDNLSDHEKDYLYKLFENRYFLVRQQRLWIVLGSSIGTGVAFLLAAFAISWAGTLAGLRDNRAQHAAAEAEEARNRAVQVATEAESVGSLVPVGGIIAFHGDLRHLKGDAWQVCDGSELRKGADNRLREVLLSGSSDGVARMPNLDSRFLHGTSNWELIATTGGAAVIPNDGSHSHSGQTGVGTATERWQHPHASIWLGGSTRSDNYRSHTHRFTTATSGGHNHGGENRPPFYTVVYVMRVK